MQREKTKSSAVAWEVLLCKCPVIFLCSGEVRVTVIGQNTTVSGIKLLPSNPSVDCGWH